MNTYYDSAIIRKEFFRLLPLQILVTMVMSINGIIDGVVASNMLGASAVAVVGLFGPIVKIMDTVSAVILTGSQILCGQYMGKNAPGRVIGVNSMNLTIVTAVSGGLTAVCLLFPNVIARGLGANQELLEKLKWYILGISPGFIPAMIATQLSTFLQLQHKERRTYIGIACMGIVNASLDVLFVSVLDWGMLGLGLATSAANWVFAAILGTFLLFDQSQHYLDLKTLHLPDLKDMIIIGFPGAVTQFCQVLRGLVLNYLILHHIGSNASAAFGVVNVYGGILFAVTSGLSSAVRILISIYQGEEDRTSLLLVMRGAMKWGITLEAASFFVVTLLSGVLTGIFYRPESGELFATTRFGLIFFSASMILSGIYFIFSNFHQCFGRAGFVNLLAVMDGAVSVCILSILLVPRYAMNGIWFAQLLNGVVTTLLILGYAILKNRHLPTSIEELIVLPKDFGGNVLDRLDAAIHSMEETENLSQQVYSFCSQHGMDSKTSLYASICLEELAANIILHGFRDHRKHSIDIRVICIQGTLRLRIRDDAVPFDPVSYEAMFSREDITKIIGLRMVSQMAKKMEYQSMLGLNVLTLEFA